MAFDINIPITGSQGNMNIIDDHIVIDAGVTRKFFLEQPVDKITHIFISHEHGDHLSAPPLNWLAKNQPWVIRNGLYVNEGTLAKIEQKMPKVYDLFDHNHILTDNDDFEIETPRGTYRVRTYPLDHNVMIQGFILENAEGDKLIHATDTTTMAYAPDEKFNYFLVEGNWDEERQGDALEESIKEFEEAIEAGDYSATFHPRAIENWRHLSIQACQEFIRTHALPGAKAWQLHESGDYGFKVDLGLGSDGLIESMRHALESKTSTH